MTPCHEVENFLPPKIVSEAGNYNNASDSRYICELMKDNGCKGQIDEIWLYFDIKKGVIKEVDHRDRRLRMELKISKRSWGHLA